MARKQTRPFSLRRCRIGVIGLGYVGLPLAVEFGRHYETTGFDVRPERIAELARGRDRTLELESRELRAAKGLRFTANLRDLRRCRVFIVTVPTPIDDYNRPDLTPLERASSSVGKVLKRGDIVVYESTVYPGCTEEVCVPILERISGLGFNRDFFVGYSPERINPGDRKHRLTTIRKVTSGSTPEVAAYVDKLYASIITAGTHPTSSIRVAEAAKVIENVQRDVNIALINELAMIFNRLGIDTEEVLEAAGSKWNFLPFRPGLVGGHCIGIDPYYLTHKAQQIGYHPEMILAGRRINDNMALYVAGEVVRLMTAKRIHPKSSRVLVLGLAFKENCPDLRNSKVADLVSELEKYGAAVDVWDPWVSAREAREEYGIRPVRKPAKGRYDAIVVAVAHRQFRELDITAVRRLARRNHVLYDIKYVFGRHDVDGRL
ncbi:MAG: Vi polysaccharide biosynthesis UDP-N-acetylglucosamine C-6 dehydrogenase TviB [Dongiaceae bacterium]